MYMIEHATELAAGAVEMVCDDMDSVAQRYDCAFNIPQRFFAEQLGFGATANLFVERGLFDLLGGFDAELRSGGDQKFCLMARSTGKKLAYLPTAKVQHPARRTISSLVEKTVRVAVGRAQAFPSLRYYFPRVLSLYPPSLYNHGAMKMSPFLRLKFTALHYALEAMRIVAYTGGRWAWLYRISTG
jgi:hypothetical protein